MNDASPALGVEQIEAQERDVDFERFGHRDAWQVGSWLVERALEQHLPITIAIWLGEQRVFHAALPGTSADNGHWVARKAAVVRRYDASSLRTTLRWKALGVGHDVSVIGLSSDYVLSGGAFPIRVRGTLVGVIAVSGLDEVADHETAVDALRDHLARSSQPNWTQQP